LLTPFLWTRRSWLKSSIVEPSNLQWYFRSCYFAQMRCRIESLGSLRVLCDHCKILGELSRSVNLQCLITLQGLWVVGETFKGCSENVSFQDLKRWNSVILRKPGKNTTRETMEKHLFGTALRFHRFSLRELFSDPAINQSTSMHLLSSVTSREAISL
jgi:hypothetical protein